MARKVEITLVDDFDGTPGASTVAFSYEGTDYEIDLGDERRAQLEEALAEYIGKARKVSRRKRRVSAASAAPAGVSPTEIRRWAKEQGIEVSSRGRIPKEVIEAYQAR